MGKGGGDLGEGGVTCGFSAIIAASTCFSCGCCVRGGPGLAEMPSRQRGRRLVTVEIKWLAWMTQERGPSFRSHS